MKKLILSILLILSIIFCAFAIIKNNNYVRVENEKQYVENGNDNEKNIIATKEEWQVNEEKVTNDNVAVDEYTSNVENGKQNVDKTPKAEQANSSKSGKKYGKKKGGSYGKVKTNNKLQNSISSGSVVGKKNLNVKKRRIYGKLNVNIGYGYQQDMSKFHLDPIKMDKAMVSHFTDENNVNKKTNSIVAKVGYNFYYNTGTFFEPLFGVDLQGRIGNKISANLHHLDTYYMSSIFPDRRVETIDRRVNIDYEEFAKLSGKIGGKISICKGLSLEVSGIGGINIIGIGRQKYSEIYTNRDKKVVETNIISKRKINIGYVYGSEVGLNFGKEEEFSLKVEWYNSVNKVNELIGNIGNKIKSQNIIATIGYRFK